MSELCFLSVVELSKLIHEGKISSEELVQSYIQRIEEVDGKVQAWANFDKDLLLASAKASDDYRITGKPIGPLHGIPIAIKDIFGTNDLPTECGTALREGVRSKSDCEVVSLLRSSGALVMGKTVTTEFAYFDAGKTTNPHDHTRTPGGSSSGSAAAVASFMAPVAIGSQTNGSVIRPASYCGVIGYKPTYGLISRHGVMKQSNILDHVGVFSRSIEDLAFVAKEIIKKDPQDKSLFHIQFLTS
jgi:Asp-tRNAAsn/Glu-tRNAGln amidotransferase A subunit and related amidases